MARTLTSTLTPARQNNKTVHDVKEERDALCGLIRDYQHNRRVEVIWDISPEAIEDNMFKIRIGEESAILSKEELLRYLRWV